MIKNNLFTCILAIAMMLPFLSIGQDKWCGVSSEDQKILLKNIDKYNKMLREGVSVSREDVTYVPIKFHLVAMSDGSGRVKESSVLDQLCKLNSDFDSTGMLFYIYEGFSYIDNTGFFNSPGTNGNALRLRKDDSAVNVFITENADTGNNLGTTLGYYVPNFDFIVVRKQEVINATNTLSHEVGHFFSLAHTFDGWQDPYDPDVHGNPVVPSQVPGLFANNIEKMDGSNCETTADRICDTPPDYLFGFSSDNCMMSIDVFDHCEMLIVPMPNNQMGYFGGCDEHQFTEGQNDRMFLDYESNRRAYIRSTYIPDNEVIEENVVIIEPSANETIDTYNNVYLDWEDVPNATNYIVDINSFSGDVYTYQTEISEIYVTDLEPDESYLFRVRPFSEGYTCTSGLTGPPTIFKTGNATSSLEDISFVSEWNVYPNPSEADADIFLSLDTEKAFDGLITLYDVTGKEVSNENVSFTSGKNTKIISSGALTSGVYFLSLRTDNMANRKKLVIR